MAAETILDIDFSNPNYKTDQLTEYFSNTSFAGEVAGDAAHGKVLQIDYTIDETETKLYKEFRSKTLEASFETRFIDPIPFSNRSLIGMKMSRIIVGDTDSPRGSMQNQWDFDNTSVSAFQVFISPADLARYPTLTDSASWLRVRYFARMNTDHQSDGVFILWLNGEKVVELRDVRWSDTPGDQFVSWWVGGNMSSGGQNFAATPIRRQIDNVRLIIGGDEPGGMAQPVEQVRIEEIEGERVLKVEGSEAVDSLVIATQDGLTNVTFNSRSKTFFDVDRIDIKTMSGNDSISVNSDVNVDIDAGAGNDRVVVSGPGRFKVFGAEGNDYVLSTATTSFLDGGAGRDRIYAIGGGAILVGGTGSDTIISRSTQNKHVLIDGEVRADSELIDVALEFIDELTGIDEAIEALLSPIADQERDRLYDLGSHQALIIAGDDDLVRRRNR